MPSTPLSILAVLGLNIALSEWLVRKTFARHLGTALIVIVVTAITANLGLIPTGSQPVPLYDGIFSIVAPMRRRPRPAGMRCIRPCARAV